MRQALVLMVLFGTLSFGQTVRPIAGACTVGGKQVTTSGIGSTNRVMASYPQCVVTVYLHGTTTKASPLYADGILTPLSNPFTANTDGSWQFYLSIASDVDVVLTGGSNGGFPSPITLSDLRPSSSIPQVIVPPASAFSVPLSMTTDHETAIFDSSAATYPSGSTAIAVLDSYGSVSGGKLTGSGSGVGIGIGANPVPAYHESIRRMEVTNFATGIYKQYGFYGGYYDVDSHDNLSYNWHVSDTAIGNYFFNIQGRGASTFSIGAGGTVTMNNGSPTISSTALFDTAVIPGKFVELTTEPSLTKGQAWAKVLSCASSSSCALDRPYSGVSGSAAAIYSVFTPNNFLGDDINTNSTSNVVFGGVLEGGWKAQLKWMGMDYSGAIGTHLECPAKIPVNGNVTLTNGSPNVVFAGGATADMVDRQIKLDSPDGDVYWAAIQSVVVPNSATLYEPYYGPGGTGAASTISTDYWVRDGVTSSQGDWLLYPELAAAQDACPALIQSGVGHVLKTGYAAMPVIVGAGASDTTIEAAVYAGGILDKGTRTWVIGPQNTQVGPFWMNRLGIASPDDNSTFVPFVVMGGSAQSTDVFQVSKRTVGELFRVGITGEIEGGTPSGSWLLRPSALSNGNFTFQPRAATNSAYFQPNVINQSAPLLICKAGTGQTGSCFESQDINGVMLSKFTVTGGLSTTQQIVSTLGTGTAPLVVASTTPVAHLAATPTTYNAAGTQQVDTHLVFGKCTLGTDCAITLAGSAVYTSATSFQCTGTDMTAAAAVKVVQASGSSVTFTGTGTDVISYNCIGD